ncbi:putative retrotransposon nucleocapsid protein [Trichosporon asahii var. asahii CBS 8904]|uniref:Putative retrotransposon nucleocapsid protein n=1 Tax=Trichosporon asahii var. asahii (strain CBS 8904) TaxID=1220162 RepID=K1VSL3_TRIAC|nr:putative retrotransposon nucleocapsid protein [Trichosporon asahii var. asahii CBS 8904]
MSEQRTPDPAADEERRRQAAEEKAGAKGKAKAGTQQPSDPAQAPQDDDTGVNPDNMSEAEFRRLIMTTLTGLSKDTRTVVSELDGVKNRVAAMEISRANSKQSKTSPSVTSGQLETTQKDAPPDKPPILHPKPKHAVSPTKLQAIEESADNIRHGEGGGGGATRTSPITQRVPEQDSSAPPGTDLARAADDNDRQPAARPATRQNGQHGTHEHHRLQQHPPDDVFTSSQPVLPQNQVHSNLFSPVQQHPSARQPYSTMMPSGAMAYPHPVYQPQLPPVRIETKDLPQFEGFEDKDGIERFVRAIDVHLRTGVSEYQIIARLGTLFHGSANEWFITLTDGELERLRTWSDWRARLLETFRPTNIKLIEQQAAAHRIIRNDEDVRQYFHEKKNLLRRGNPSMSDAEIGLQILGGTPMQWRANVTWDPDRDSLHDLQTSMERRAGLLHAQWWDKNLDMRDSNGHPRPGYVSWLSDLSRSANSRAPKGNKNQQSSSDNNNQSQQSRDTQSNDRQQGQRSNNRNANYGHNTEDYKRQWLDNQRKFLGRDPRSRTPLPRDRMRPQGRPFAPPASSADEQDVYIDDPYDLTYRPNNVYWLAAQEKRKQQNDVQNDNNALSLRTTPRPQQPTPPTHDGCSLKPHDTPIPECTATIELLPSSDDEEQDDGTKDDAPRQKKKKKEKIANAGETSSETKRPSCTQTPQAHVYDVSSAPVADAELNDWLQSDWVPTPTLAFARIGTSNQPHRVLIDSGADLCLVGEAYLRNEIENYNIEDSAILTINGVNGTSRTLGSTILPLRFSRKDARGHDQVFLIRFHVVPDLKDGLLVGNNALIAMNAVIDLSRGRMKLQDQEYLITSARRRRQDPMNYGHARDVRLKNAYIIQPGCRMKVPVHVITGGFKSDFLIEPVPLENGARLIRGPRALEPAHTDEVMYEFFNGTRKPIKLKRGLLVGKAIPKSRDQVRELKDIQQVVDSLSHELEKTKMANFINTEEDYLTSEDWEEYKTLLDKININENLDNDQRRKVENLLYCKRAAFASEKNPIGLTRRAVFDVDTGDAKPTTHCPYHASPLRRKLIRERIKALKDMQLIQDSTSEWSSPVIMVEQNGQWRMCVDYRALNKITVGDQYPVPRVFDILDSLEGSHWFSSFDLNKGYYQIPTTPRAAKRLAFRTQDGLYEPLRMPFGAKGAPAAFQRLMDTLLAEGRWLWCLAYIDDIIVYSKTFDDHVTHVRWVLGQMIDGGLTLHPSKSHLFVNSIDLLGHHVSNAGIAKGKKATDAITKQKRPTTVKELSRFLGLASHYRRFVKNFAILATPLRELRRLAVQLNSHHLPWNETYEAAYNLLIEKLAEDVLLTHPNPDKKFYIESDACLDGFGAVISQKTPEGYLRPIAFISRQTVDGEKNMAATELECAGLMWALEKFRPYIEGGTVQMLCDHKALQQLENYKGDCKRMQRASALLMSYHSTIDFVYKQAKKMQHVDQCSRNPLPATDRDRARPEEEIPEPWMGGTPIHPPPRGARTKPDHSASIITDELGDLDEGAVHAVWEILPDNDTIRRINEAMYDDPKFIKIVDEILFRYDVPDTKPYDREHWRKTMWHPSKPFVLSDGILHTVHSNVPRFMIYVPDDKSLRDDILSRFHDTPMAGHRGSESTYLRLVEHFWWPGVQRYVRSFVRHCESCQKNKPDNLLPPGLLKPIPHCPERWHTIQMDWMTKLPTSNGFDACLVVLDRRAFDSVLVSIDPTLASASFSQCILPDLVLVGYSSGVILATALEGVWASVARCGWRLSAHGVRRPHGLDKLALPPGLIN